MERSTVKRIGDVEQMVTSFTRHLRAENKAPQTTTAYTYTPLQLADFLQERGMPVDVGSIHREHVEAFLEDLLTRRSAATANTLTDRDIAALLNGGSDTFAPPAGFARRTGYAVRVVMGEAINAA